MTVIYLVRHGKTDDSGKRITGYRMGIHLNREGVQQASRVAEFLKHFPICAVYTSPLERTMETAEIIASKHNLPVHPIDSLKEIDFGNYQGKGEELAKDQLWKLFQEEPASVEFPHGESVQDAQQRFTNGLNSIIQSHKKSDEIVVVTHCEVLRLGLAYALKIPLNYYSRLTIDTGSVSKLTWNDDQASISFINLLTNY